MTKTTLIEATRPESFPVKSLQMRGWYLGYVDDQILQENIPQIYTDWMEESRRALYEGNE